MNLRERVDAFPTQAVLFVLWMTVGAYLSYTWRESLLWVIFMSLYTIVMEHFLGHLAWRRERAERRDQHG